MPLSLRRELTVTSSAALVVSNMIGTGIFTTTGYLAGDLGRPELVIGVWLVGGLVALAGSVVYAEWGTNLPRSGGEYVYLSEAWGPAFGFLSGWVSFFAGFCAPIAAGALAFSEYFGRSFSFFSLTTHSRVLFGLHLGNGQLLSVTVIASFAVVNVLGLRLASRVQNVLTAVKLALLVVFLATAFVIGHGNWTHFRMNASRSSAHSLPAQFAVSLIFVMFAYSGWNAASYVTEEMKAPERTLPRALLLGTGLVTLLYLALNVAFVYALPLESLKGILPVGSTAAAALFPGRIGNLFSGIMAVALLSCVSAMSLVGPRVYYAMAQDGCFPAGAARVHPRWLTPVRGIIYQAVASAAMVLTGTFEALIYYIGFLLVLFAALAVGGLLRVRNRPRWFRLRAVSWHYPAVPFAFVLASLWMLIWTLMVRPRESSLGVLTVICGWLFYRWKFPGEWLRHH